MADPTLAQIVAALDPAEAGPADRAAERLAALLHDPVRLAKALARLPGAALALLELLTEIPDRLIDSALARREVERRLGRAGSGGEAEIALSVHQLLLRVVDDRSGKSDGMILPGLLANPMARLVRGLTLRTVDPAQVTLTQSGTEPASLDFAAALLAGAFHRDPPKVTQAGEIFSRAQEKLAQVYFPGDRPAGLRLALALQVAQTQGALEFYGGGVASNRQAVERAAHQDQATRRADWLSMVQLSLPADAQPGLLELLSRQGSGFVPISLLRSVLAVQRHARRVPRRGERDYPQPAAAVDARVDAIVQTLRQLPEVSVGRSPDGEEVLRLAVPTRGTAEARAYVQPNLEILLPPGVDPLLAYDVARIAEVRRVEAVAQLALTARSVRQARDSDLSAEAILDILERVAPGAVPGNVRTTVADWATGPAPVRLIEGAMLFCPDPASAEAIRRGRILPSPRPTELAPGVWAVSPFQLEALQKALAKAKIPCRPQIEYLDEPLDEEEADRERPTRDRRAEPAVPPAPAPDPVLLARVATARVQPDAPPRPAPAPVPAPARQASRPPPPPEPEPDELVMVASPTFLRVARSRAGSGEPLEIEVRQANGGRERFAVAVDRTVERRDRIFLEGRRLDTEEDVSIPIDRIAQMRLSPAEQAAREAFEGYGFQPPVRREAPKVGRNDPCPCGSGRKYKKCCGRGA
jgi:hypothetical protein